MSEVELTLADLWATRISPDDHPVQHLRPVLDDHDVVPIDRLGAAYAERRVQVAGLVTHRQRPSTAGGVTFLNLEDETGMLNGLFIRALEAFRPDRSQRLRHDHSRQGRAQRRCDQPGGRTATAVELYLSRG